MTSNHGPTGITHHAKRQSSMTLDMAPSSLTAAWCQNVVRWEATLHICCQPRRRVAEQGDLAGGVTQQLPWCL